MFFLFGRSRMATDGHPEIYDKMSDRRLWPSEGFTSMLSATSAYPLFISSLQYWADG